MNNLNKKTEKKQTRKSLFQLLLIYFTSLLLGWFGDLLFVCGIYREKSLKMLIKLNNYSLVIL